MKLPTRFPATFNYRGTDGQWSQQVSKQGHNKYTVKTWVHRYGKAEEIACADNLQRWEAIEQLDYQGEFAEQLIENIKSMPL